MNKDKNFSNLTKEQQDKVLSECCEGTNKEQEELVDSVFPSDTFINENKLRDEWLNYIFPRMSLINKETIATWWIDKLKSSLQSQREAIEKEMETKIRVARSEGYLSCCKENGIEPKLGKGN